MCIDGSIKLDSSFATVVGVMRDWNGK
ncbi:hypothetical protein Golax_001384 [Gossypium laxum]|uniref:Uncharacterized protein n=1 Tax=Gossypium laxum TaxID=34288 RepID=A0A7J9AWN9_9ROSI|nr:hypothetical protein [Gossypium laxum]